MRIILFCLSVLLVACGREQPLPVLGSVPQFQLTDQLGHPFEGAMLDGHVWVADFIFTHCEGPCPRMSSHMRAIQKETDPSVRLVSFTVDPANDTPPVLESYGRNFGADDSRWRFLTGDPATLNSLDHDAFHLGNVGAGLDHSTRFVLIDKKGRIRGYYGIAEGDPVARISKDAVRLEKEQA
ncbi:MAG TPA: SCO family protein [Bryobacteraceae bacterium]|jgi:protein SCO1/2|nr:SCO family protein [Bryobacteraceae bacterium]